MIAILLSLSGTADASPLNSTPPEVEIRCFFVNGKLICDPPLLNPQGGSGDGLIAIRTSDAEEQSDHPPAFFAAFEGIDGWYAYALFKDYGDEASYGPAVEGAPDETSVTVKDINGDGVGDVLIESEGEVRAWFGPMDDVRHYDDFDEQH